MNSPANGQSTATKAQALSIFATFNPYRPTSPSAKNLTGQRFGRLLVLGIHRKNGTNGPFWLTLCDCGTLYAAITGNLIGGSIISCGCARRERVFKHGGTHSPEYNIFNLAKKRCENPTDKRYADYGGRGIEFRFDSFENFLAEVGPRPSQQHSLDRRDNSGHYEAGNVKWSTRREQNGNKRNNVVLTFQGKTQPAFEWAKELGIQVKTIYSRHKRGWSDETILTVGI